MVNQAGQTQWNPISETLKEWPSQDDFFQDKMELIWSESLGETQEWAREGMYGAFHPNLPDSHYPESKKISFELDNTDTAWKENLQWVPNTREANTPIEKVTTWSEVERKRNEGVYSPLITDFVIKGHIPPAQEITIQDTLLQHPDDPSTWLQKVGLAEDSAKQISECIKYIESGENIELGRKNLEKDFSQELKEFTSPDWDLLWFGEEAITLLAKSYVPNKNKDGKVLSNDAINLAFRTAANTCIFEKSIKRTESFEAAMRNTRNWSLSFEDRFAALQGLLQMTNKDQWIKGRKKQMEHIRMKKWREVAKLEKEIQNIQYEIEREEQEGNNKEKIRKLKERQDRAREKLSEVVQTGEADMWWWQQDVMTDIPSERVTENS